MSAPVLSMSMFHKMGRFMTYSRISWARFHQRMCLQNAAASLPAVKFIKDPEGNIIGPANCAFPKGIDIDPEVAAEFEMDQLSYPKRHPGLMHFKKAPWLPEQLKKNARLLLAEKDLISSVGFEADVKHLQEVYLRRHPPYEKKFKMKQIEIFKERLLAEEIEKNNIDLERLNEVERRKLEQRVDTIARKIYKEKFHAWNQIEYKDHTGLVYLAARLAPNYTVLLKIFDEIQRRDKNFVPESVLNVGSGTGSAIWAVNHIWDKKVNEYYCVDTSSYMNHLARRLISKDITDPLSVMIPGVNFRQFIPSPEHDHNRFPLVVSAYLLMEQKCFEDRLNLVSLLLELTEEYLVLVEHGTKAGYLLMMEAREIIKQIGREHPDEQGHVFAPCTHDMLCPKLQMKNLPCTFPIEYRKLNIGKDVGQGDEKALEKYSYIVFKKGPRQEGKRYSRVTKTILKPRHTHSQLCCPDGSLRQFAITKSNPSLALFRCARKCQVGDFLPFHWPDTGPQNEKIGPQEEDGTPDLKSGIQELEECDTG